MAIDASGKVDYQQLIREDGPAGWRIHGSLYTDPAIFDEEMEKIFYRGWSFVGHESEVPQPGDFQRKLVGLQPVIMTRDEAGKVRVFYNRCAHRGNLVCRAERGSSKALTCIYHGWTYSPSGELIGVPYPAGYDDDFSTEGLGLAALPRVANYRGFIFASLAEDGTSLDEYLGNGKDYIDHFVDLSPTGEIELSAGVQKVRVKANWKLQPENIVDQYHVNVVHQSSLPARDPDSEIYMRDLGGGHAILDWWEQNRRQNNVFYSGNAAAQDTQESEAARTHRETLEARLGRERAEEILRNGPPHIALFPTMFLLFEHIRVVQPISVNECFIYFYPVLLKGAPREVNVNRVQRHNFGYGSAGFIAPDDCEIFESIQRGLQAREPEWLTLKRGVHRERYEGNDFGREVLTSKGSDETAQRAIWRHYRSVMSQP